MELRELDNKDYELIEAARDVIARLYEFGRHHVGAALRTKSGEVFTAVHVEAYISRVTVCAEAMVIGKAISEGFKEFESIVAVLHPDPESENREIKVVSPCGICRELIGDYGQDMNVLMPIENKVKKVSIDELLPMKYKRTE